MSRFRRWSILITILFSMVGLSYTMMPDGLMKWKEREVDKKTIPMQVGQGREMEESSEELGVKEVERPGGGKDTLYYSIITTEEEKKREQEEKEKLGTSLEMLRNITIEKRRK